MTTKLINRTGTRKLILALANSKYSHTGPDEIVDAGGRAWSYTRANSIRRGKQFTQVSQKLLQDIDTMIRLHIESYLNKNPQTGKTVK